MNGNDARGLIIERLAEAGFEVYDGKSTPDGNGVTVHTDRTDTVSVRVQYASEDIERDETDRVSREIRSWPSTRFVRILRARNHRVVAFRYQP